MKKVNIYLAGPLFSHAEINFNALLRDKLVLRGFSVFLPQEDGCDNTITRLEDKQKSTFKKDIQAIDNCDLVVAILDGGSDVDSGTAWEIGYAYSINKPVFGLKTDFRTLGPEGNVNLMIEYSLMNISKTIDELLDKLKCYN